jgi:transcription elongation factor GreA
VRLAIGQEDGVFELGRDLVLLWQIVGAPEADAHKGKISVTSLIARALIGKTKDDTIEVDTPLGSKIYKVRRVAWFAAS